MPEFVSGTAESASVLVQQVCRRCAGGRSLWRLACRPWLAERRLAAALSRRSLQPPKRRRPRQSRGCRRTPTHQRFLWLLPCPCLRGKVVARRQSRLTSAIRPIANRRAIEPGLQRTRPGRSCLPQRRLAPPPKGVTFGLVISMGTGSNQGDISPFYRPDFAKARCRPRLQHHGKGDGSGFEESLQEPSWRGGRGCPLVQTASLYPPPERALFCSAIHSL
jgi:hypothetical protein